MSAATRLMAEVIKEFREVHPDITSTAMLAFLYVAENEGTAQVDVARSLNVTKSAITRIIDLMTKRGRGKVEGLDLISQQEDPTNRTLRTLHLTQKGKGLVKKINNSVKRTATKGAL